MTDTTIGEVIEYLRKREPTGSEPVRGGELFNVACVIRLDWGLTAEEVEAFLRTVFNPRCTPPFADSEIYRVAMMSTGKFWADYLRKAR